MQTCSRCDASSPDLASLCLYCGADLSRFSKRVVALRRLQANWRVSAIRVSVSHDACPACEALMGTYPKDAVPLLPHADCAHPLGCRCFYEPVLNETAVISRLLQ